MDKQRIKNTSTISNYPASYVEFGRRDAMKADFQIVISSIVDRRFVVERIKEGNETI